MRLIDADILINYLAEQYTESCWSDDESPKKASALKSIMEYVDNMSVIDAIPAEYHIPQPDKVDVKAMIAQHKLTGEVFDGCEFKQEEGIRFR